MVKVTYLLKLINQLNVQYIRLSALISVWVLIFPSLVPIKLIELPLILRNELCEIFLLQRNSYSNKFQWTLQRDIQDITLRRLDSYIEYFFEQHNSYVSPYLAFLLTKEYLLFLIISIVFHMWYSQEGAPNFEVCNIIKTLWYLSRNNVIIKNEIIKVL